MLLCESAPWLLLLLKYTCENIFSPFNWKAPVKTVALLLRGAAILCPGNNSTSLTSILGAVKDDYSLPQSWNIFQNTLNNSTPDILWLMTLANNYLKKRSIELSIAFWGKYVLTHYNKGECEILFLPIFKGVPYLLYKSLEEEPWFWGAVPSLMLTLDMALLHSVLDFHGGANILDQWTRFLY